MARRIQSPSSILAYKFGEGFRWGCPRKYYLRYIKRLRTKPKPALVVGGIVHKTVEGMAKAYRPEMLEWDYGEVRRLALGSLGRNWGLQEKELMAVCQDRAQCLQFFRDCEVMVLHWLHQFTRDVVAGKRPRTVETKIVNNSLGVQGVIDVVNEHGGRLEILDYKTGAFSGMTPETMLQLAIYSLLFKEEFGRIPDEVCVHFLRVPSGTENPLRFKPDSELIAYAAREVEAIHLLTQSDKECDYPCLCGGRCEEEFRC